MQTRLSLMAMTMAVAMVAVGCSKGTPPTVESPPNSSSEAPSPSSSASGGPPPTIVLPGGIRATNRGEGTLTGPSPTLPLEASNQGSTYFFSPTVIHGSGGEKVTLQIKNTGNTEHNFSIDALKISKNIQPGQQISVTVTVPSHGQLVFYCAFHKAFGMAGEIVGA